MSLLVIQQKLLKILAENSEVRYPQVTGASEIANKIGVNEKMIKQVIRSMAGLGLIESDLDGQYALITHQGLSKVRKTRYL